MTPRDAETSEQICELERDNITIGDYWILVQESEVCLHEQPAGEDSQAAIRVPREVFNKFVDWYQRGIVPAKHKQEAA